MKLGDLLQEIYTGTISEKFALYDIQSVGCDSRKLGPGSLFVSLKGSKCNGSDYIDEAIVKGAVCIVIEASQSVDVFNKNVCFLKVEDAKQFLKVITKKFFNSPSKRIQCLGITGTNGKTTISYIVESILTAAGKKCGVIGTINCHYGEKSILLQNTTPNIVDISQYLSQMVENGFSHCALEVSSHALDQGRVDGLDFKVAIFSNLTQDHLDYHPSMEDYFYAKSKLFSSLSKESFAIVNVDDRWGRKLIERTQAKVSRYGIDSPSDVMASNISLEVLSSKFLLTVEQDQCEIETSLIGKHNIYNILAAAAACRVIGIDLEYIQRGIENVNHVPGRLEPIYCKKDFSIFVDYAHTDDALKNVLTSIRETCRGKVILVFGCGGDRDKGKRVKMGEVASALADFSIITNDNPRSENPDEIVKKIASGFQHDHYLIFLDRQEAIKKALSMAQKNDVVLIAGKGHEDYQILKQKTLHFDDRQVIRELLR